MVEDPCGGGFEATSVRMCTNSIPQRLYLLHAAKK